MKIEWLLTAAWVHWVFHCLISSLMWRCVEGIQTTELMMVYSWLTSKNVTVIDAQLMKCWRLHGMKSTLPNWQTKLRRRFLTFKMIKRLVGGKALMSRSLGSQEPRTNVKLELTTWRKSWRRWEQLTLWRSRFHFLLQTSAESVMCTADYVTKFNWGWTSEAIIWDGACRHTLKWHEADLQ